MYGKKVTFRIVFLSLLLISSALLIFTVLKLLEDNVVYFKSPTEIKMLTKNVKNKFRVGGMVKKDSVVFKKESISFIITDFKNEINVTFSGSVPNLFQEEKGVVAEGVMKDKNYFIADKILAKHDENYMPPEVKKSLGE